MGIEESIRLKRYEVINPEEVQFHINTEQATQYEFKLMDCSISGARIEITGEDAKKVLEEISDHSILPASKIVFGEDVIYLGRLAVRRISQHKEVVQLAVSTIDHKIPVDKRLSKHLKQDFSVDNNQKDFELSASEFSLGNFIAYDSENVDIFDRCRKYNVFYNDWCKKDRFAYGFQRTSKTGPRVNLKKLRMDDRTDFLMFGSNDYLGLSHHPAVTEAAIKGIEKYGMGSTGTALTSGITEAHEELAEEVARMYGREDCVLFSSGFNANLGLIAGLAKPGDLIVADIISHASMQDGMAMSKSANRLFKHNDMNHLEKILKENRDKHNGCLILSEGAFSMDGTLGDLKNIAELAHKYNARTYIDQGHCFGVLGDNGLGTSEVYKVTEKIDLIMGLFSKGVGTMGGFVVGSKETMNWFRMMARSYMFATTFPPSIATATLASLKVIQSDEGRQLREKLANNVKHFVKSINRNGEIVDPNHMSPIIPVTVGDENILNPINKFLLENGVLALPVHYPAVARNKSRFRFSLVADHTVSDLDFAIMTLQQSCEKSGIDLVELSKQIKNKKIKKETTKVEIKKDNNIIPAKGKVS